MSGAKHERLLRWYPKPWRDEHGRFMLDTLEERAGDRGMVRPSLAEAWSIRSHGLGERVTQRWAVMCSAMSLAAFVVAAAILFSDALTFPGASTVRTVLAVFIGPLALAFAAIVLLLRKGQLTAPASMWAAVLAAPAFALTALASESWALGFQESDAGDGRSWFGSATLVFIPLAWLAGSLALLAPVSTLVSRELPLPARRLVAVIVSALLSVVVGVMVIAGQMFGGLAAAAVLVASALAGRRSVPAARPVSRPAALPSAERSRPQARPDAINRSGYAKIGAAALFSLVPGIGSAAFALTGSAWAGIAWVDGIRDSTHAMGFGLAAGALVAIPAVAAFGVVMRQRFGPALGWSAVLVCTGLVVVAAAQFLGNGHRLQWPLILAAAVLVGFALAVPLGRIMSAKPALRLAATGGLGLAGSLIGVYFVMAAAFIVPLGAVVLLVWSLRCLSGGARPAIVVT